MPPDIGLAAERVLAGCLDTNVASRWTIATVDEVAWGIGWASHDSSPASDDEPDCDPIPIHNRTRTISTVISDSDSDSDSSPYSYDIIPEDSLPGGLSRDSSSSRYSSSRSRSPSGLPHTLRYIPASLLSLNDSILGAETTRNSSNSSTPNLFSRGRPRMKVSPERVGSRSLSPSMVPLTPPDLLDESGARPRRPRAYGTDSHTSELGRTRGTSRLRWRGSELDNIEELSAREKWSVPRSRHSSRSRLRDDGGPNTIGRRAFDLLNKGEESSRGRSSRSGGQPSRSSSSVSREQRFHEVECDWVGWRTPSSLRDGVREETVVGRMGVRSRSVGLDFGAERARTRKLAPL